MRNQFILYFLTLLVFWSLAPNTTTADDSKSLEIPVWSGVAPDSEGIIEQEIVLERGKEGVIDRSFSQVHKPTITITSPKTPPKSPRPAIVICPGGGFSRVVLDKEGIDFARFLNQHGIVGITLKYRTAQSRTHRYGITAPEADVKRAIQLARFHSNKWGLDPKRIGVFGFSAGGFIASTAATHFEAGNPEASDPVKRFSSRPDFLGLAYPVISLQSDINRDGYRTMLLGPQPDEELVRLYSNELQVTSQTPPTFLCHTRDDSGVTFQNSELFEAALVKAGVECASYICDTGGHGFGVRDLGHPVNLWRFEFIRWLQSQDIINQ